MIQIDSMKRSSSEIPSSPISSASDNDTKPDIASTPPKTKKAKSTPKTPTPRKRVQEEANGPSSGGGSGSGSGNGEWDSEKRGLMMDIIIAAGYKATDLESLANQVSLRFFPNV